MPLVRFEKVLREAIKAQKALEGHNINHDSKGLVIITPGIVTGLIPEAERKSLALIERVNTQKQRKIVARAMMRTEKTVRALANKRRQLSRREAKKKPFRPRNAWLSIG